MPYTAGTIIDSATPVKDLMAAIGTQLTAAGLSLVETYQPNAGVTWNGVAYGNGVFVAVGNNTGSVATSTDGVTWTSRTVPYPTLWSAIAYGNGLFVAVSSNSAVTATSPDGVTWTIRAGAAGQTGWSAITYGAAAGFVAIVSGTQNCMTSPDGIAWTLRQNAVPSAAAWTGVAYGAGTYVAVGSGSSIVGTSTDGIVWVGRTISSTTWTAVTYGGGQFVAVASGSTSAATSPDGITWTARTLPASVGWNGVAYGGGVFAAVAGPATVSATSPDGATWTQRTMPAGTSNVTTDVWKSPAASNSFGQDWYLLLMRQGDYNTQLFFQVAEQYTLATHKAANFGGTTQTVAPAATSYANPAAATTADTAALYGAQAQLSTLTQGVAIQYWISATPNRLVVGVRNPAGAETGFYAGLYDDLLPAGTTGFPLVCAALPTSQTVTSAIGGGNSSGIGGFTREPLQAASSSLNFEARIHNGFVVGYGGGVVTPLGFTPYTTASAPFGNANSVARVMLGSGRTGNLGDALRGLLIGCVTCGLPSVAGDTFTAGGKTYVRIGGPAQAYGIFVDQGV